MEGTGGRYESGTEVVIEIDWKCMHVVCLFVVRLCSRVYTCTVFLWDSVPLHRACLYYILALEFNVLLFALLRYEYFRACLRFIKGISD